MSDVKEKPEQLKALERAWKATISLLPAEYPAFALGFRHGYEAIDAQHREGYEEGFSDGYQQGFGAGVQEAQPHG